MAKNTKAALTDAKKTAANIAAVHEKVANEVAKAPPRADPTKYALHFHSAQS
jgi:hypothetical protein